MTLHFDSRWANNYGYRPIQVTATTSTPAAFDRTIKVRLYTKSWEWRLVSIQVEQEFELPAGSATANMAVSLPQASQYQWIGGQQTWWDVWVNGVRDRDLSNPIDSGLMAIGAGGAPEAGLAILAIGTGIPSRQSMISNSLEYEMLSLSAADLPTRWLDYTCFDVVALTADELRKLENSKPEALTAIRRWARAGGQLWLFDAGQSWEKLAEIEQLLQLQRPADAPDGDDPAGFTDDEALKRGWDSVAAAPQVLHGRVVTFSEYNTGTQRVVRDEKTIDRLQRSGRYYVVGEQTESKSTRAQIDFSRWFLDQPLGLGGVRAFRGRKMHDLWSTWAGQAAPNSMAGAVQYAPGSYPAGITSSSNATTTTTTNVAPHPEMDAALDGMYDWRSRHGLAPDEANAEFSNWLVPGVGLAPVTEFRVLITLFVLLIGPVNYLLLKRYHRLHLLVITVPLAAVVLTAALFAYALVADGLSTTVRVRSLTMLDQPAGEAATWARISYYAGLAPGQGLTMPDDTAVYPIIPTWFGGGSNSELQIAREVVWDGDQTRLSRGWLRSRTPTQYLALRACKTPARLQLQQGQSKMRAKNELGTSIRYVVVADPAGELYEGENMAEGATADLLAIDRPAAVGRFREFLRDNLPQPPEALASMRANDWMLRGPNFSVGRNSNQHSPAQLSENLMELALLRWTSFDEEPPGEWRKRSYVAVTKTGPEVRLGVEAAREEASFHVVVGRW